MRMMRYEVATDRQMYNMDINVISALCSHFRNLMEHCDDVRERLYETHKNNKLRVKIGVKWH